MKKEKKLVKDFFIYFVGNFASKILIFLLLPLYTNYLTRGEYGEYDILVTTVMLLEIVINLKFPEAVYRWLLDSESSKEEIISLSWYYYKISILIFSIIFILLGSYLKVENLLLIFLYFITTITITFSQNIIRGLQKNKIFSLLGVFETLIFLTSNLFLIIKLNLGVNGILISKTISNLVWIIPLVKIWIKTPQKEKNNNIYKKMLKYSIPLIPSAMSWWLIKVADRYCISYLLGIEYNGIYAVASKFPSLLLMVNNIFYLSWQENSIINYDSKDRDSFYTNVFNKLSDIQLSMCLILIPIIKIVSLNFLGEAFKISWKYSIFLLLGSIFSAFSSFYAVGYLSRKDTVNIFKSSMLGAGISLVINILFMKKYGLQVASLATMISFLCVWLYRVYDNKKYFNIQINYKKILLLILFLIITIIITFFLNKKYMYFLFLVNILISIFFNKEIVIVILKRIGVSCVK